MDLKPLPDDEEERAMDARDARIRELEAEVDRLHTQSVRLVSRWDSDVARVCEENDALHAKLANAEEALVETREYFEIGIRDDAERACVDHRGMVGMAIVHMMANELEKREARFVALIRGEAAP